MVKYKLEEMYIPRKLEKSMLEALGNSTVVALIGPRQCGKSTLVKLNT